MGGGETIPPKILIFRGQKKLGVASMFIELELGRFPICHKKYFNWGLVILILIGIFAQLLKFFDALFANGHLGQAINFYDIAVEIFFLGNELGRNFPSMVSG